MLLAAQRKHQVCPLQTKFPKHLYSPALWPSVPLNLLHKWSCWGERAWMFSLQPWQKGAAVTVLRQEPAFTVRDSLLWEHHWMEPFTGKSTKISSVTPASGQGHSAELHLTWSAVAHGHRQSPYTSTKLHSHMAPSRLQPTLKRDAFLRSSAQSFIGSLRQQGTRGTGLGLRSLNFNLAAFGGRQVKGGLQKHSLGLRCTDFPNLPALF